MKKIAFFVLTLFSLNTFAVTIVNKNTYAINYDIRQSFIGGCSFIATEGHLSPDQAITWVKNSETKPDKVCISAWGKTSITGTWCPDIKNEGSVVEIRSSGFLLGISCECVSGCE